MARKIPELPHKIPNNKDMVIVVDVSEGISKRMAVDNLVNSFEAGLPSEVNRAFTRRDGDYAMPNTGWFTVEFNSVILDPDSIISGNTITIQRAGFYYVKCGLTLETVANDRLEAIRWRINGNENDIQTSGVYTKPEHGLGVLLMADLFHFETGETIQVDGYYPTAITVKGGAQYNANTDLRIVRLNG